MVNEESMPGRAVITSAAGWRASQAAKDAKKAAQRARVAAAAADRRAAAAERFAAGKAKYEAMRAARTTPVSDAAVYAERKRKMEAQAACMRRCGEL